jgi:hypothetical protein
VIAAFSLSPWNDKWLSGDAYVSRSLSGSLLFFFCGGFQVRSDAALTRAVYFDYV